MARPPSSAGSAASHEEQVGCAVDEPRIGGVLRLEIGELLPQRAVAMLLAFQRGSGANRRHEMPRRHTRDLADDRWQARPIYVVQNGVQAQRKVYASISLRKRPCDVSDVEGQIDSGKLANLRG
jgi:hypothetical protein